MLAWTHAVRQAEAGQGFDAILAQAYPGGVLGIAGVGARCRRLFENETWLATALPRWERILLTQPGYERPPQLPLVCALNGGAPYPNSRATGFSCVPWPRAKTASRWPTNTCTSPCGAIRAGRTKPMSRGLARRLLDANLGSF
ncbi:DUF2300 domain-containing protein [Massilia sp. Se16.2.3]|uniref:DUF2300 domain-containing protein n=1 Tax=Massilia sp. Se16.2.3 TaxID=2709303 RepID=UPI00160134D0|nr:DUF2300 domain-containing protein [Massilia sp. Se16.2.3]QNB00163.1 DUF2300 domain-containing protein [Massilia sp. Se16.2.3]